MELRPSLFCLSFCLLYFFLPPFEDLGCFSGCLMPFAGIQKLFCGIYSAFKCSFNEFVGEKVFSPSYSSAILAPPRDLIFKKQGENAFPGSLAGLQALVFPLFSCINGKFLCVVLKEDLWSHCCLSCISGKFLLLLALSPAWKRK